MTIDELAPGTRFMPASKYDTDPKPHVVRDKRLPAPGWPHPVKPNAETLTGEPVLFSPGYPVARLDALRPEAYEAQEGR